MGDKKEIKNIFDLPLSLRQKVGKDIMELSEQADNFIENGMDHPSVESEEWPVKYIFSKDNVIVLISVVDLDTKEISEILILNVVRAEVDKLNALV